ncbi:MAG: hypothetical protein GWO24_34190 [Akkermansiaceae bacterium]|nr:hypothetical protein [Akkermansiaceae bacterium]
MPKPSPNEFELGDASEQLAKRFLPRPLRDDWLVLPQRGLRWTLSNVAIFALLGGFLLGAFLSRFLSPGHLLWIALVLFAVPLGLKKFVVDPLEQEDEAVANLALRNPPPE